MEKENYGIGKKTVLWGGKKVCVYVWGGACLFH